MTLSDSEQFFLNIPKNPSILHPVYRCIEKQRVKTEEEISEETALSGSLVHEAVSVLLVLNLIEKRREIYHTTHMQSLQNARQVDLRLKILNRLAEKSRTGSHEGWTKQAAFYLIYRFVVQQKIKVLNPSNKRTVEEIKIFFKNEGYDPRSSSGAEIRMNAQKLDNWVKLAAYCGIMLEINDSNYLTFLNPNLFLEVMEVFQEERNGTTPCSVEQFLRWSDDHFLPTYQGIIENPQMIPAPYSDVLATLHQSKQIELLTYGDHPRYRVSGSQMEKLVPTSFNAFRCTT